MKIGGYDFNIKFNPDVTSAPDLARKFCVEQGSKLGITQETLENCIGPVSGYLQKEMDLARSTQPKATANSASQGDKFATKELAQVQVNSALCCMFQDLHSIALLRLSLRLRILITRSLSTRPW